MSIFKNTVTGDITTVFGPLHDNFLARPDQELIVDDRDAELEATEAVDLASEVAPVATDSSGDLPEVSQDTTTSDAFSVGNPKE